MACPASGRNNCHHETDWNTLHNKLWWLRNVKPVNMSQRIVSIWLEHLVTDWKIRREPELKEIPFVLGMQERNRRVVKAVNAVAQSQGIYVDMVVADAR